MLTAKVSEATSPAPMQLVPLTGHLAPVLAVAFSKDGSLLATTGADNKLLLWEVASGSLRRSWAAGDLPFVGPDRVAFSPDGQTLAVSAGVVAQRSIRWAGTVVQFGFPLGRWAGTVIQHSTSTGRWTGTFPGAGELLGYLPDGTILTVWRGDTLRILDSASGQLIRDIPLGVKCYFSPLVAALSEDGESVAIGFEEGERACLQVWDLASGALRMQRLVPRTFWWTRRHRVTGERRVVKQKHGRVKCLALSPDGRFLAVGGDYTLWICDTRTGRLTHRLLGASERAHSLAFSPDGKLLASGTNRGWVDVWRVSTGRSLEHFQAHYTWVSAIAFSPDGALLATGGEDKSVQVWEVATGECRRAFPALDFEASALAYSPDSGYIAVSYTEGTIRLWNARTGALERLLYEIPKRLEFLHFSLDGALLATGFGSTAMVWDVATGQVLQSPAEPPEPNGVASQGQCEARSPDGCCSAISTGWKGSIELRRCDTGELLHLLTDPSGCDGVVSLAFSPDAKLLAAGHDGFWARLWDVESGELIQSLRTHADAVGALAFSPDGSLLAVGGDYRPEVVLRDLTAPRPPEHHNLTSERRDALTEFRNDVREIVPEGLPSAEVTLECSSNVRGVAFSPDGRQVATVGQDAALKLWEPTTGCLLATLLPLPQEERPSAAWIAYTPVGYYHGSVSVEVSIRWRIDDDLHEAEPFAATFNCPDAVAGCLR